MENFYVYGLCQEVVQAQELLGIQGCPVGIISSNGIGAIISPWSKNRPQSTPENLVAHNNVLESMTPFTTVLPVRFGTLLSLGELHSFFKNYRPKIIKGLSLVRDRVEMGLKIMRPEIVSGESAFIPSRPPLSGKNYMEGLLARCQKEILDAKQEEKNLEEVWQLLLNISVGGKKSTPRSPCLINWAFLMEKEGVEEFFRIVEKMKKTHGHLIFLASGPWPPYSFASWEEGYV